MMDGKNSSKSMIFAMPITRCKAEYVIDIPESETLSIICVILARLRQFCLAVALQSLGFVLIETQHNDFPSFIAHKAIGITLLKQKGEQDEHY